jgi:hypothetical protein
VETESRSNYFNFLEFDGKQIRLDIFSSQNAETFGVMAQWKSELSINPERGILRMSDREHL